MFYIWHVKKHTDDHRSSEVYLWSVRVNRRIQGVLSTGAGEHFF